MTEALTMTATPQTGSPSSRKTDWMGDAMQKRIARRYAAERRFKFLGLAAVATSSLFLAFLLVVMIGNGAKGFVTTEATLTIDLPAATGSISPDQLTGPQLRATMASIDVRRIFDNAVQAQYGEDGARYFASTAWTALRDQLVENPNLVMGKTSFWLPTSADIDRAAKDRSTPQAERDYAALTKAGEVRQSFNMQFLTGSDGTDPARVGIWGALKGSLITMVVTLFLAFPVGVLAAVYLEEYAPKNRFTDLIEVSINNLAAVPSIIFGLLGLAVFLQFLSMPRSAALVGGLTLALMTMPVIVIAARNAIKAVPPSIREAAMGVGASPIQVVFHHVLPLAIPGIMTGTIIGMARALGETAPLLMIGMRAFTTTPPDGLTDPATVLPVQIFLWSDEVNRGFVEKTSAAIIVLLVFLLTMNAIAVYLRNRFETRW
ncbi:MULTISPECIES: phosphate ABC transporter permease PstA [unclassified Blastomonas]|jgi:phosphate transport system permease protein|uniref:phosphate ABC transporter permease PstA n=3 Tax=Pseudomonadota TaxID=1224 RepID=UPI00076A83B9|nr:MULTISPECIES: phosphate ABC transporter permease PstA [unclassified Blastomonas]MAF60634.1 phosphate ABC transporter, permease protein PstA [Blastomonas sp.]|tara:strand:- start:31023 stop:32318 length:1296 start_codon:yes stop_codon:yes gene_type:complete